MTARLVIICFALLIASSSSFAADPFAHPRLKEALGAYQASDFEAVIERLQTPFDNQENERQRLVMVGLARTWLNQWDAAAETWNAFIKIGRLESQTDLNYSLPKQPFNTSPVWPYMIYEEILPSDAQYIWRTLQLQRTAALAAGRFTGPELRAVALADFVYRHVLLGQKQEGDFFLRPYETLALGMGWCEEIAWVYNQLLRSAGVDGNRLVLFDPESGVSHHSIACASLSAGLLPVDCSYGIILKNPNTNKPENLYDLKDDTEAAKEFGIYESLWDELYESHPIADLPWEAHTPRMVMLSRMLEPYSEINNLARDIGEVAFSRKFRDSPLEPRILDYIYQLTPPKSAAARIHATTLYEEIIPFQGIRLAMLEGRIALAEEAWELKETEELSEEAREYLDYHKALCQFELGEDEEAKAAFTTFYESRPGSAWRERAAYHLARIARRTGDAEAYALWRKRAGHDHPGSLLEWMDALEMEM